MKKSEWTGIEELARDRQLRLSEAERDSRSKHTVRASLVRSACDTARTRALREQTRVNVWYSMSALAGIRSSDEPSEVSWVLSHDEGVPKGGLMNEDVIESAFILCWYDERGEFHKEPALFDWYKDNTMQPILDMLLCGKCGDRVSNTEHGEPLMVLATKPHPEIIREIECESCGRPVMMPGL